MKIIENLEQNTPEWLEARRGKITGSKLGDIVVKRGTGRKLGFYELVADNIALEAGDENPMDRGHRLEDEALSLFEKEEGVTFRRGLFCISDENPEMAVSPDGLSKDSKRMAEVKCLSTPKYLQAYFEKQIPSEYEFQKLQYFIVNPKCERLDFVFYDPRVTAKPMFFLTFYREDLLEDIELYKQYQVEVLSEVNRLVAELAF
jgi:putative phage-type endonuclease